MSLTHFIFAHLIFLIIIVYAIFHYLYLSKGRRQARRAMRTMRRNQASQGRSSISDIQNAGSADVAPTEIEPGELPERVKKHIAEEQANHYPWTSALSVTDWLLLKKYKLKPMRMVMGTAYYHFGFTDYFYKQLGFSGEVSNVEDAMYASFQVALARLKLEAKAVGAHAVVGVKLRSRKIEVGQGAHEVEYTFMGTAVRMEGHEVPEEPVLCTVSVPEFAKLVECGSMPVGMALGIGIYYQYTDFINSWQNSSWSNQEIQNYTEASYYVREIAMKRFSADVKRHHGHGVLAHNTSFSVRKIDVDNNNNNRIDHLLEFVSMGTVVTDNADHALPTFKQAIALNR